MKKVKVVLYIFFLLSLTMFGYNGGEKVAMADSGESAKQVEASVDIAFLKEKIQISQTKDQVTSLLGDKYAQLSSAMDGAEMWRFDFAVAEDYQFLGMMDEVDIQGIKDGALKMQVFITWNEQAEVEHIAAYFIDGADQLVHEYMKFGTGEVKDSPIE